MRLRKLHGLGNDYLVLEDPGATVLDARAVVAICDRHTGAGGDGVLEPCASDVAHAGLRIWNPDGSLAEKSGNGLRIFARWLVDHRGAPPVHDIQVLHPSGRGGVFAARVHTDAPGHPVTMEMGRASLDPDDVPVARRLFDTPVAVAGTELRLTAVGVGNPHCVAFVDADLDGLPWRAWGEALEVHPWFPNRTNVQVARVVGPRTLEIRIWERGAGPTTASGSSSCAVAAAAVAHGKVPAGPVQVQMPGGALLVHVGPDLDLTLRGPVEEVGAITLAPAWIQARLSHPPRS